MKDSNAVRSDPEPATRRDERRPAAVSFTVYEAATGDDGWYWRLANRIDGEAAEALI